MYFCYVVNYFGFVLLRFEKDLGFVCYVLQRFGVILLRSASIRCRSAPLCSDFGAHSLENELVLLRMSSFSSE